MNGNELLEAVGDINERYILNASAGKKKTGYRINYGRIAAIAGMVLLVAGIAITYRLANNSPTPNIEGKECNIFTSEEERGGGTQPGGLDGDSTKQSSVAVLPATENMEDVVDATITELSKEDMKTKEGYANEEAMKIEGHLKRYFPTVLPEGYTFAHASLYETTMESGMKYYMIRTTYQSGPDEILVWVMSYRPDTELPICTLDSITENVFEELKGDSIFLSVDDVFVGISLVDSWNDLQTIIHSINPQAAGEPHSVEDVSYPREDAEVDEETYSEAKDFSDSLLGDLQNAISAEMGPGKKLSFVISTAILENPDRLHVVVNTKDENLINLLKSYNAKDLPMEIEYSDGTAVEE